MTFYAHQANDLDATSIYGKESIRYKLTGDGSDRFRISTRTGVVTVRDCTTPGRGNCLDAEQQGEYLLTVVAKDSFAEGLENSTQLLVTVLNTNDNPPLFTQDVYIGRIREGETVPYDPQPLQVTVGARSVAYM